MRAWMLLSISVWVFKTKRLYLSIIIVVIGIILVVFLSKLKDCLKMNYFSISDENFPINNLKQVISIHAIIFLRILFSLHSDMWRLACIQCRVCCVIRSDRMRAFVLCLGVKEKEKERARKRKRERKTEISPCREQQSIALSLIAFFAWMSTSWKEKMKIGNCSFPILSATK